MSRCRDLSKNKQNIVVQGHVKNVDRYLMAADGFTIATFNVENYFLTPYSTRKEKAEVSREKAAS